MRGIIFFTLFLLLASIASAEISSTSYTIEKFHIGSSGNTPESTSFNSRFTLTYEQPGNNNVTSTSFLANSGWFNVSVAGVALGGTTINSIECSNDTTTFLDCTTLTYGQNLTHIRANCTSGASITNVTFTLHNDPDNVNFIDNQNFTFQNGDFFVLNSSFVLQDSGDWNITVTCNDTTNVINSTNWTIPFGTINVTVIKPANKTNITSQEFFNFSVNVSCVGGECANTSVTLDPRKEKTSITKRANYFIENILRKIQETLNKSLNKR